MIICCNIVMVRVNNLDDMNMLNQDSFKPKTEKFNVRSEFAKILELHEGQAGLNKNNLSLEIDPWVENYLTGDKQRIRQITSNYLSNSNKFTREGKIVVRVQCVFRDNKYMLSVEVLDTGIGFDSRDESKLFKPFSKLQAGNEYNPNGNGLSLSLCKRIAENLGGNTWCKSERKDNG